MLGFARALKDRNIAQKSLKPTYTLQYVVASVGADAPQAKQSPPRRAGDCFGGWRRLRKDMPQVWILILDSI
ncbi:MAG: hypothetical protein MUO64_01550 [Anaerolineales bacterium]|nr:hypothetical protein [Anaerolineales bacterium]